MPLCNRHALTLMPALIGQFVRSLSLFLFALVLHFEAISMSTFKRLSVSIFDTGRKSRRFKNYKNSVKLEAGATTNPGDHQLRNCRAIISIIVVDHQRSDVVYNFSVVCLYVCQTITFESLDTGSSSWHI